MKSPRSKSVTLLELLIAIVLMSLVVLGLSSIDLFSRYHVITSDKRAKLQNEVSYVLEHMTKQISKAIGNEKIDNPTDNTDGVNSVVDTSNISSNTAIHAYIDSDGDGQRDDPALKQDRTIAYRFTGSTGRSEDRYQIRYCPDCENKPCAKCEPKWGEEDEYTLSKKIIAFTPTKPGSPGALSDNYVEIELTACYDPDETPVACDTPDNPTDNPSVKMKARIKLPSVSIN